MKGLWVRAGIWVALFLAVMWGAAFALCCRLTSEPLMPGDETDSPATAGSSATADSVAIKALGASRVAMGDQLYANADRTFHMGVGVYRRPAFTSWFTRLGQAIAPEGHVHLHAEGVNELVPWLYLATRADPHNVEAYVVAAFWLAGEGGRPDLAERVLDEARANNPKDYRVYLEKGRLALKRGTLTEAARAFDVAGRLWERDPGPDKIQARLDRAEMLVYRGLLYEEDGDVPRALTCYRNMLTLFPGRVGIRERVAELAERGFARVAPTAMRQTIMFQRRHVCEREQAE
ncbi:MAG: tetratricopeptide repeat protein [Kiritimatiellae bacterium]|nr:tetratricopeptide repeat protein [Verrucomicrobiota bacterium]MBU4286276.1 tetratricopeptide repeat protein [Verrucomicrobiota bacterium]MBU4365735.1 tetratricopeptide repeat protein [Verrucomicrobiota bacterium]MCG2661442.1 tetratricopeptide repeat protein [Kiritimatiellia bacterium]